MKSAEELAGMDPAELAEWLIGEGQALQDIQYTERRDRAKELRAPVREAADLSKGSGERLALLEVASSLLRVIVDAKQEAIEQFYDSGVPAQQIVAELAAGKRVNSSRFQQDHPELLVLWENLHRTGATRVQCLAPGPVEHGGGWLVFAPDVTRFQAVLDSRA